MRLYLAGIKIDVETPNLELLAPYLEPYSCLEPDSCSEPDHGLEPYCDSDLDGCGEATGAAEPELAEIRVMVSEEDIAVQRKLTKEGPAGEPQDPGKLSDLAYEFTALYKKILHSLVEYKTIYLHGSLIAVDGNGYLFMAPSGTGKSTHARLWREVYGDKVKIVNDDKPLFKACGDGGILACGSPWNGKHGLGCNECVPLRAVVRLRRGKENRITELDKSAALKLLLLSTLRFKDARRVRLMLEVIYRIIENVRLYDLECNMEPEAAKTSYERLVGEQ